VITDPVPDLEESITDFSSPEDVNTIDNHLLVA
jgi:hypothetical protein